MKRALGVSAAKARVTRAVGGRGRRSAEGAGVALVVVVVAGMFAAAVAVARMLAPIVVGVVRAIFIGAFRLVGAVLRAAIAILSAFERGSAKAIAALRPHTEADRAPEPHADAA